MVPVPRHAQYTASGARAQPWNQGPGQKQCPFPPFATHFATSHCSQNIAILYILVSPYVTSKSHAEKPEDSASLHLLGGSLGHLTGHFFPEQRSEQWATLKFSRTKFPGSVENKSATRRWSNRFHPHSGWIQCISIHHPKNPKIVQKWLKHIRVFRVLNNRPKSSHHLLCPSTVSLRVPLNKKENVATPRHAVFCPRSAPESRGVVSLSYMMWRSNFGCQQWQNEAPWDWQLKEKAKQQTRWIEWMRKCFDVS